MGGSPFLPGSVGASAGGGRICAPDLAPRHQLATRKALNAMFRPTLSGLFRISVSRAALISKYSAASNARSPVRRPHTPGPLFGGLTRQVPCSTANIRLPLNRRTKRQASPASGR